MHIHQSWHCNWQTCNKSVVTTFSTFEKKGSVKTLCYLQVKVDAARQLAMQSSLVEYFRRFFTKPSNMWLEMRSKIHDRMHLDLEARTQIFCAYNVNTGNWDDDNAPENRYELVKILAVGMLDFKYTSLNISRQSLSCFLQDKVLDVLTLFIGLSN